MSCHVLLKLVIKMGQLKYLCLISSFLCILNLASGQLTEQENPSQSATRSPPNRLLADLGDFFLNVDETLYKLTSPREQNENAKQEQIPSPRELNSRTNYFDQVRQNYEELQRRIQESFENPANVFRPPEIMNLNFQNRGQKSFLDLSLPFLPMNVQLRGKEIKDKSKDDGIESKLPKVESPFSDYSGSINIGGDMSNLRKSQSDPVPNNEISKSSGVFQKRSNRYNMEALNQGNKPRGTSYPQNQASNSMHGQVFDPKKDEQISSTGTDVEGRVLGDLLYSEDTFDKHFKRVLKDGKWAIDPEVFFPKKIVENVREFTKNQLTKNDKRKGNQANVPLNQNAETRDNMDKSFTRGSSESGTKSDILLAFTPDGAPLKLQINSLHGNPLKYLNRVLVAADVSLNIPIESHRSLQPAGKDVLQLGSRSDGGQTHATYIDLNDEYQLKSLLRALKKSRK